MEGDTVELMNRSNEMYHTFMENGEYIFYYRDKAGNVSYLTVPVNCIDDNEPDAQVLYTPAKEKGNTKEDVVITISPYDIDAYGNGCYLCRSCSICASNIDSIFVFKLQDYRRSYSRRHKRLMTQDPENCGGKRLGLAF